MKNLLIVILTWGSAAIAAGWGISCKDSELVKSSEITCGFLMSKIYAYTKDTARFTYDMYFAFDGEIADSFYISSLSINTSLSFVAFKIDSVEIVERKHNMVPFSLMLLTDLSEDNQGDIKEREIFCRELFQRCALKPGNNFNFCAFGDSAKAYLKRPVQLFAEDFVENPTYFDQDLAAIHEYYSHFNGTANPYSAIDSCIRYFAETKSPRQGKHLLLISNSPKLVNTDTAIAGDLRRADIKLSVINMITNWNKDFSAIAALSGGMVASNVNDHLDDDAQEIAKQFLGEGKFYRLHITARSLASLDFEPDCVVSTTLKFNYYNLSGNEYNTTLPVVLRFE